MTRYLSHTDYNRWARAYLNNLQRFADGLAAMHLALDDIRYRGEVDKEIDNLEAKFDLAIPRNFNDDGEPLTFSETFVENMKVLINLVWKALKYEEPYRGIYFDEKSRILHYLNENKLKDNYIVVRSKVEELLREHKTEEELAAKKAEEELAIKKAEEELAKVDEEKESSPSSDIQQPS